jgi:hypothetical protein
MAKVSLLALLFAAMLFAVTCSPFGGGAFQCANDSECQGAFDGRCESNGFCSFPDESCGIGGRRYGELSGALGGKCTNDVPIDAAVDAAKLIDAQLPEAGETCLGVTGGFANPCFAVPPSGSITLNGPIDTNGAMCSTMVSNTTACVIAAGTIQIDAGATVTVTGSKPLVLAATSTVTINGVLDVASHHGGITPGAAGNDAGCDNGTAATSQGGSGGGGAGGSFGAKGGNGGGVGATAGTSGAAQVPTTLRGGCRGQDGHEGGGVAATRGVGGNGGGAVYIIGQTSIVVGATGVINASGAGSTNGVTALAGGGGGGSGGLIGLDSISVTSTGLIFANGGSGAEGSGNAGAGSTGSDPIGAGAAIPVTPQSGNGGDGGNGGAAPTNTGANGGTTLDGGGAGGAVGVIRVFPLQALGGAVSPAPT